MTSSTTTMKIAATVELLALPYLPTEVANIIFDYKDELEKRDKHNSLTKSLITEFNWNWRERKRTAKRDAGFMEYLDINDYTACRRCHCIDTSTLDNEFKGYAPLGHVKGSYWGALDCGGCLTLKEKEEEDIMWCAIKGIDEKGAKEHPFWCEEGY